jgi:hypothetical protein
MMTFTASLSYGLSFLGGLAGLRPQICTTVSAFATGIVGNAHARLTGHTATIPINAGTLRFSLSFRFRSLFAFVLLANGLRLRFSFLQESSSWCRGRWACAA